MEEQDTEQVYQSERSILLNEIKGTIVLVNEAAASAEESFRFIGESGKTKDAYPVAAFYKYFMRLYKLTQEIIKDKDLLVDVAEWFKSAEYDKDKIWNIFQTGLKLSDRYQKELYELGIKDMHLLISIDYPYGYFEQFIKRSATDGGE